MQKAKKATKPAKPTHPIFRLGDTLKGKYSMEIPDKSKPGKKKSAKVLLIGKVKALVYEYEEAKWDYYLDTIPMAITEKDLHLYDEETGKKAKASH